MDAGGVAHPQHPPRPWGLQSLHLSGAHSLEGSREAAGCWGPDVVPGEAGSPRAALVPDPRPRPTGRPSPGAPTLVWLCPRL